MQEQVHVVQSVFGLRNNEQDCECLSKPFNLNFDLKLSFLWKCLIFLSVQTFLPLVLLACFERQTATPSRGCNSCRLAECRLRSQLLLFILKLDSRLAQFVGGHKQTTTFFSPCVFSVYASTYICRRACLPWTICIHACKIMLSFNIFLLYWDRTQTYVIVPANSRGR